MPVDSFKFLPKSFRPMFENVQIEDLGRCKKMIVDKDTTTIIEGAGKPEEIEAR